MSAGGSFPNISGPPVSGPAMSSQPPVPSAPVLGQVVAGALAATTYFVKLTFQTSGGESLPGAEANLAVLINNVLTVASPAAPAGAQGVSAVTGYNVYASNTGGGGSGAETKQAGPIAIGTAWQEPNTGLVGGAAVPTISNAVSRGAQAPMGQEPANLQRNGAASAPGVQSNKGSRS